MQQYDFVIELNPALLPRYYQNIHVDQSVWAKTGKYANATVPNNGPQLVLPAYDQAQLLFNDLSVSNAAGGLGWH